VYGTAPPGSVRAVTQGERDAAQGSDHSIRIYLVDDHAVVRRGMRAFLEMVDGMEVVGEASNGEAALEGIEALIMGGQRPDVVMMDLLMPGMDGIAATTLVKERHPEVEVIALTSFVAQDKIHAALAAGAAGYVLKDAEADEVAAAIRAVHRGEVHLAPEAARQLAASLRTPRRVVSPEALTERERQVLALVAEGASNKDIGRALSISERTARTHVSNILTKLDLASRTQAALWAIREGLASPDEPG
jgi:DNA-binding NarL/FixJ family response regulator